MPRLRDANHEEAASIAQIYNQSIAAQDSTMRLASVDEQEVEQWIDSLSEREAILVLEDAGTVVGWGILKQYSKRAGYRFTAETSVYLQRNQTGHGYGSQLQRALIERARLYDYHHLVAKIWADNEISIALHRKFGYEIVGVQNEVGYVGEQWQDVAIMQKLLDPS